MKKRVDDLATFVKNGGYLFEEEVEMNFFGTKNHRQSSPEDDILPPWVRYSPRDYTRYHPCDLATAKLGLGVSTPSEFT